MNATRPASSMSGAFGALVVFLAVQPLGPPARGQDLIPLVDDVAFDRGLTVLPPAAGGTNATGVLVSPVGPPDPVWRLAQWHSRFDLGAAQGTDRDGWRSYFDGAKSVAFATGADAPALSLGLDADTEYRNKVPEKGDAWPHLLVERNLIATPSLQEVIAVPFEVQLKRARADAVKHEGWNPQQHTAQFVFYLVVRNANPKSDGFGDYFWCGVLLYDTRYPSPEECSMIDRSTANKPGTDKVIHQMPYAALATESVHSGHWVHVKGDLLPHIRKGLQSAWSKGHLGASRELSDYRLEAMNMGWEVTGPLNVTMQIRGFNLQAEAGGAR
jgi:hypothetical protein